MQKLKEKLQKNIAGGLDNPPETDDFGKVLQLYGGGLFYEFEWMPDSYETHLEKEREDKVAGKIKQKQLHPSDFIVDTNPLKLENPSDENSRFFAEQEDPYEAGQDDLLRAKWMKESKIINGDFKPAGGQKSLSHINRTQLPDIVIYLKEVIRCDWAEINFIIGTNPDEMIEIKFERSSDADQGLKPYMNTLIGQNETISGFNLKRELSYWGHKDEKFIYFMLIPPWIKGKVSDTYEQVLTKEDKQGSEREESSLKKKKSVKLYSSGVDI